MITSLTKKALLSVLFFTLVIITSIPTSEAKSSKSLIDKVFDGAISGAASFGAEVALNAVASGLFLGYCGKDQVSDDVGAFICSVIGDVSGDNDAQWRESVEDQLKQIDDKLIKIAESQSAIEKAIGNESEWIRTLIKELPERQRVHDDLSNIQNGWSLFVGFFKQAKSMNSVDAHDSMKKLAIKLLNNNRYNVDASAHDLRVAIAEGHNDIPPLPLLLAQEISRHIHKDIGDDSFWTTSDPEDFDIRPHYIQLELALQRWMLRQRQAQVMTLFANRVLSDNGEISSSSSEFFGERYFDGLEQQLESFQKGVEWLILNHSFPRSPFKNFLPKGSNEVFQRADALQAIYLTTPDSTGKASRSQAIWGRVISMGDSKGSHLEFTPPNQKKADSSSGIVREIPILKFNELDWWSASDSNSPNSFDSINFAKTWKVYRYKYSLNEQEEGSYGLTHSGKTQQLPVLAETVEVDNSLSDITGLKTLFGTFLGISRAGGAYALFSGEFKEGHIDTLIPPTGKKSDLLTGAHLNLINSKVIIDRSRGNLPRLFIADKGQTNKIKIKRDASFLRFKVDRVKAVSVSTNKKVTTSLPGQNVQLNVLWNGKTDIGMKKFGFPSKRVIASSNNWQNLLFRAPKDASYSASYMIGFGTYGLRGVPMQGLQISEAGGNGTPVSKSIDIKKH